MLKLINKFLADRAGNFAMLTGICLIPIGIAGGLAVDYSRASSAKSQIQSIADAAALAAAASGERTEAGLKQVAENFVKANAGKQVANVRLAEASSFDPARGKLTVVLDYSMPTSLMKLAGIRDMKVAATSEAELPGGAKTEIALVLDTTYSMTNDAGDGETRIDALRRVALKFVDDVMPSGAKNVRMSVVPYADYVNVGVKRRNAPWLYTQDDFDTGSPASCSTIKTKWVCDYIPPAGALCDFEADGVPYQAPCQPSGCHDEMLPQSEWHDQCTPATSYPYTFKGCVYDREDKEARLTQDKHGVSKYHGGVSFYKECDNELVPLTDNRKTIIDKIKSLDTSGGPSSAERYGEETYIPAGLEWGWNTLSSNNYFPEGKPDPAVKKKALILMSDGANTAVLSWVMHTIHGFTPEQYDDKLQETNDDMLNLCSNIKAAGVEIYAVSFDIKNAKANDRMADCATSRNHHFYKAVNGYELGLAFDKINASLTGGQVRLVK